MQERYIGIYCIVNKINYKKYVGQSIDIKLRWKKHINSAFNKNINAENYNYPLYRAMRKYGINNFEFQVLEKTSVDMLDKQEIYWIDKLKPEYNQTIGGGYYIHNSNKQKLNKQQAYEIQQALINDTNCTLSHMKLAQKYSVTKDTIQAINVGRTWHNPLYNYPLHYSKYDKNKPIDYYSLKKFQKKCERCGKPISYKSQQCTSCYNETRRKPLPSRDILKQLIYTKTFTDIGKMFDVSINTVKRWCQQYDLPYKYRQIHKKEIDIPKSKNKAPVKATSLIDNSIYIFQSISEATNWLIEQKHIQTKSNGIRSHISEVCKGKRKTAYNFLWEYIIYD